MKKIFAGIIMAGAVIGCATAQTQQLAYTLQGRVVDSATGRGLMGITVSIDGHNVITDAEGQYKIKSAASVARISYVGEGFTPYALYVAAETNDLLTTHVKDVCLYDKTFITADKQAEAFTNTPSLTAEEEIATRLGQDVRTVQRSGQYGMGANMFIRGLNSLNANAQPLIILDGTLLEQPSGESSIHEGFVINHLLDFDVNDIESIRVIKDATALYGSKGGNGVIVIDTKRGHSTTTHIAVDLSASVKLAPTLPKTLSGDQFRTYVSEILKGSATASSIAGSFDGYLNESPSDKAYNTYHNHTDWNDEVYQTGVLQRYALNVQGGDDAAMYSISVGYLTSDDVVRKSTFDRLNTRVNTDIFLTTKFKIGTEIYFTQVDRELRDDGSVARTSPTFIAQIKSPFLHPYAYTDDGQSVSNTFAAYDAFGVSNPNAILSNAKGAHKQYRFNISATPEYRFSDRWSLSSHFAYYFDSSKEHYFSPLTGVVPATIEGKGISYNTVKDQTLSQSSIFDDTRLTYTATFADRHHVDAFAGYRLAVNSYKDTYGEGHNTGDDKVFNLSSSLSYLVSDGSKTEWNSTSLYAHATYTYNSKYTLWAEMDMDASSRFGTDTKEGFRMMGGTWATFPAVGARWNVMGESFMQSASWLDHLQLHASWGMSGNDDIDGICRYSYLTPSNYLGVAVGKQIGNLANSALQWETTSKLTAGAEVSLWHDRIRASIDVYRHQTDNLLTWKQADLLSGLKLYLCNGGKLENKGVEATLAIKAVNAKDFKWSTGLAINHYKNEITALPDGDYTTDLYDGTILTAVGHAAGVFYGYKTDGVLTTTAEATACGLKKRNANATLSTFTAGDIHFLEPNAAYADGIIDEHDRTIIGDPNPDFTGTFTNTFGYRNFSLDVLCSFSVGGDLYNYRRSLLEGMSNGYNQSLAIARRWKSEGQETDIPKATYGDPMGNSRFSDRWIEDGSYFKIKNVRLSYHLPINNPWIESITLWGAAGNLCTFTRYLGADPEVSAGSGVLYQGIDNGLQPSCRTFSAGIKLNL